MHGNLQALDAMDMGACFQAPHCCTWTMTDGNALCPLIKYFILQHIALTRSCVHEGGHVMSRVMYPHLSDSYKLK